MEIEIAVAVGRIGRHVQEGDIVAARLPIGVIGIKERRSFLWMRIDTDIPLGDFLPLIRRGQKVYPYRIELDALIDDGIDLIKARDTRLDYQPYAKYKKVGRVYRWQEPGLTVRAAPLRKA